ncbi:SLBB domain-containing protein [Sphingoaurantiacus capsulatus]|uniref:SLBB domain-containing protein n=1 Tax=Sphingoaurantiacus capsulatus TaxID=1771310 RepID=A0ABV7XEJ8_9SPHN
MRRQLRFNFARRLTALCVASLVVVIPALAQQIDPSVLGRIQGQLGAGTNAGEQLDQSRQEGDMDAASTAAQPAGPTSEELELRRQRSRVQLDRLYTPSTVEREYRERLGDPTLRQFGYDLFRSSEGGSGPLTGAVGDGYILGVGDQVVVSFQGATNESQTVRVDREGRIVVGQIRPIRAAGRSIGAVRSELAAETRRTLLGTDVYISLGSVRAISVFVGGEVERPGQYRMTSLGDVATAIARAGGIRRNGSLRNVRIERSGGGRTTVDLYGLLGIGTPSSVRLQDGDRIVIPVIGGTVAVAGAVARPGIYEVRGSTTLSQLISYAGGALRPRGYQAAVSRIAPDGSESFIRATGSAQTIMAGDAVQVSGGSAGGAQNRVALSGFVANPGARALGMTATVRELLGDPDDLRAGTYLPMAVLARRDEITGSRVYEGVNLITALRNSPAVPLRSGDDLFVFSRTDIDFLNSAAVRRVVTGQGNLLPECRSLENLRTLAEDVQSSRFAAVARGSGRLATARRPVLSRSNYDLDERQRRRGETPTVEGGLPSTQTQQQVPASASGAGNAQQAQVPQLDDDEADIRRRRLLNAEREADRYARSGGELEGQNTGEPLCPAVFEAQPDLLPMLIEHAVTIGGAVREPGAYPVATDIAAASLVSVAQGTTVNSRNMLASVIRADDDAAVAPQPNAGLASLVIRPGDDLRIGASQPQFEMGGVLLSGEFAQPGYYTIRKGETLGQLITRAGGLSRLAYPYGAIFTRKSVKELQQEGFKRTARELNAGLLAAISRRGAEAGSLTAATDLIDRLSNIEAPGRMVVETDPQVLAVRPELDTVLEGGDVIVMPKTPNFVLVLGDVNNPGALQFVAGKSTKNYVREAGGLQSSAEADRAFLVLPNGTAQPLSSAGWTRTAAVVPPGSTIIVPKEIDPGRTLDLVRDVATIFGQFATAIASIAILSNQ